MYRVLDVTRSGYFNRWPLREGIHPQESFIIRIAGRHTRVACVQVGGAVPSMGKKGDCCDNAVVESFFSTLKRELPLGEVFHTRQEGRSQGFEHLEVFYNRQRRHSTLSDKTPLEFHQRSRRGVTANRQDRGKLTPLG
ncbi:IS3 family transposase [Deinococcus sp. QL22]|uniref:IS3 family transposase n=1 Tax=Deinococcus sp. QL22 TaxID=2939437 RepID=UPI0035303473